MGLTAAQKAGIGIAVLVVVAALVAVGVVVSAAHRTREVIEVILAGCDDNGAGKSAIARSVDGGVTWTDVPWPFATASTVSFNPLYCITHDGTRFLASTTTAFMTSVDGLTWSSPNTPPVLVEIGDIAAVSSNGTDVVLGCSHGIAYYNGTKWTNKYARNLNASTAAFITPKTPTGPTTCMVATLNDGLNMSSDRGATWVQGSVSSWKVFNVLRQPNMWISALMTGAAVMRDNVPEPTTTDLATTYGQTTGLAGNGRVVLVGNDAGVFKLDDANYSFTKIDKTPALHVLAWTGKRFVGIHSIDSPKEVYASNAGDTWTKMTSPWPWTGLSPTVDILALAGALVPVSGKPE